MGSLVTSINLRYLHCTKNRHGKRYYAFRKKGHKRVRLPNPPGSPAFMAAYQAALAMTSTVRRIQPGSMGALVKAFYGSIKFAGIDKKSTQRTYQRILDNFIEEHGDKPVALLEMHHIGKIIAAKATTPAAANQLLKRLKQVLDFAVKNGWIRVNPAKGIEKIRYTQKPIHTWTERQAHQFVQRHPPGTMAYSAYIVMSCTGVRRSDLITLGSHNIYDDHLVIESVERNEEYLNIPLHPLLSAELANLGQRSVFMVTEYAKPFSSSASFGNWFRLLQRGWAAGMLSSRASEIDRYAIGGSGCQREYDFGNLGMARQPSSGALHKGRQQEETCRHRNAETGSQTQ